jgi:hypothetical protein
MQAPDPVSYKDVNKETSFTHFKDAVTQLFYRDSENCLVPGEKKRHWSPIISSNL